MTVEERDLMVRLLRDEKDRLREKLIQLEGQLQIQMSSRASDSTVVTFTRKSIDELRSKNEQCSRIMKELESLG